MEDEEKAEPRKDYQGKIMRFVIPDLLDPNAHTRAVRRAVGRRAAEVRREWHDHNQRIRPLLTPALQQLQETTLHDALIRSLRIDVDQHSLELRLLCDDQNGDSGLCLTYRSIQLTEPEISLICLIAHAGAEVAWDEIDLTAGSEDGKDAGVGVAPAVFIHRMLWNTSIETGRHSEGLNGLGEECWRMDILRPEVEFRFGGLDIETVRHPAPGARDFPHPLGVITIVRDSDGIDGMAASVAAVNLI